MKPVTDADFQQVVREHLDGPVVVKFHAEWCNPCKDFAPLVDELAKYYEDNILFVSCDVDQAQKIASELNIRTVPSLALFSDGMVRDILVGRHPKSEVRQWINESV
jgi:thioredoxin